jgi:hypothetical protein
MASEDMGDIVRDSIEQRHNGRNRNRLDKLVTSSDYTNLSLKKQILKRQRVADSNSSKNFKNSIVTKELQRRARE